MGERRAGRVVAAGAVTALGVALRAVVPAATAACDGQECDPHQSSWGCESDDVSPSAICCAQGHMLDPDHWETTLANARWLPFDSYDSLHLHFGAWTGKRLPDPGLLSMSIAAAPPVGLAAPFPDAYPADAPDGGLDNTTAASGNLGEVNLIGPGEAVVENATCSPTVVRVVVTFPSIEGGIPPEYIGPCQKYGGTPAQGPGGG